MKPSRKRKEIAELLRREISRIILYELSDPRMGFVTVTRVELAGDYRSAKVFMTVRGSEGDASKCFSALDHARGHIQALVGDRLKLRYTPVLSFLEDKELGEALRVDRLIGQLANQRQARADEAPAEADQDPSDQ